MGPKGAAHDNEAAIAGRKPVIILACLIPIVTFDVELPYCLCVVESSVTFRLLCEGSDGNLESFVVYRRSNSMYNRDRNGWSLPWRRKTCRLKQDFCAFPR